MSGITKHEENTATYNLVYGKQGITVVTVNGTVARTTLVQDNETFCLLHDNTLANLKELRDLLNAFLLEMRTSGIK